MSPRFLRFLASGAVNTLLSYGVYVGLLWLLPYRLAYSIAFASGILLAYALNRYFVFRSTGGGYGPVWVVAIYALQYTLGIFLVTAWVDWIRMPAVLGPAFAVLLTVPLTYVLTRRVFSQRRSK